MQEMNSGQLLFVFVRNGIESTLERSPLVREHMGLLLHQLIKAGALTSQQYYKGWVGVWVGGVGVQRVAWSLDVVHAGC